MAVPKKKTSKSRRDKRRATHRLEAPRVNECPNCHQPKRPHHAVPELQDVPRPRRRAARIARPVGRVPVRVAVDAMGGDRGPDEIVAGALDAAADDGVTPVVFGPQSLDTHGLELDRGAGRDRDGREAGRGRARRSRTARSSSRCRAVARRARRRRRLGREHRRRCSPRACSTLRRLPGVMRPAIAVADPRAARPVRPARLPARTPTRARSTCSSSPTWAPSSRRRSSSVDEPARAAALDRRGAREGQPAHARGARAARRASGARLRGQRREPRTCSRARATSSSCDGFTGNVCLKLLEGTIRTLLDALREEIAATPRGKLGGLLIRPAARAAARRASTRTRTAAPTCSACAGSS